MTNPTTLYNSFQWIISSTIHPTKILKRRPPTGTRLLGHFAIQRMSLHIFVLQGGFRTDASISSFRNFSKSTCLSSASSAENSSPKLPTSESTSSSSVHFEETERMERQQTRAKTTNTCPTIIKITNKKIQSKITILCSTPSCCVGRRGDSIDFSIDNS